jgi:P4 family phage/plasmid primase-like protien
LTIGFDLEELWRLKHANPEWVILLGDKSKNPSKLVGAWKDMKAQTMADLQTLVAKAQSSEVEAWNFGPRTGLGGLACLDWDWEFLAYRWIKCFGDRAKTLTFRTPNMGFRMLYFTTEKENSSPFKRGLHMEFENGGYVAVGGFAEDSEGKKQPYLKFTDPPILIDNAILADTKAFLVETLDRYDFLCFNCVSSVVDRKHIRLDHNQRLAVVQFMVSKNFVDDEIHDFFKTVYRLDGTRDYDYGITSTQISSARSFYERGGRPNPCTPKTNPENGHVSTPLFQIFGSDSESCRSCIRKQKVNDGEKDAKEKEIEQVLEWLRCEYIFKTPTDLRDLFYFEDGIYKPAECKIEGLLEKELGTRATSHFVMEVLEHLRRGSYVDRSEFNRFRGFVPVQNGLLDLKTLDLKPFDAEVIYTYKLNVKFDASAKCPKWLAFLPQILLLDDHALLQEYMGYCLLPVMPKHKIMWFYGGGRNGKGRITITLEAIMGQENCSHLELGELDGQHRFAVSQLYGKLVNICSEPSTAVAMQTALLKKITGEDSLDAEVKGKQKRISFRNVAKMFVLGNEFPKVNDSSVAFHERTLILSFPYSFTGKNQVDDIERQWLDDPAEVSGIFNWMLLGLHRLWKNNDFTVSKTTKEVMLEFKRTSDPFGAWIEDNCVFEGEGFVSRKAAFEDYKAYADEELRKAPETERKFFQRLRDTPKVKEFDSKREGRGFKGIRLKSQEDRKLYDNGQIPLDSDPGAAAAAGLKNFSKNPVATTEDNLEDSEKCAASAAGAADSGFDEGRERKILRVERSGGEPCEGATSGGGDCGFGSEYYLLSPEGQRSAWCNTHLKLVLSMYDSKGYDIKYGSGGYPDG